MRIFFSGSEHHLETAKGEGLAVSLREAGYDLGFTVARRQHTILVTTDSPRTIDYHLVSGAQALAQEEGLLPTVQIHRMLGRPEPFADWESVRFERIAYQQVPQPEYKRLGVRVGAISTCDAVILLGGRAGTQLVGQLALDLKKPVIAIQSFGGSAADVFDLLQRSYLQMQEVAERVHVLVDPWDRQKSAGAVIEIAEILAGHHTYFLSYAHENQREADHIEVLLRRRARTVFRDEAELKLTEDIKRTLEALISKTDTFVALWSRDSNESEWCVWERETAGYLSRTTQQPKRIVFLLLDDTRLPEPYSGFLQTDGADRSARDRSVADLIRQESAR